MALPLNFNQRLATVIMPTPVQVFFFGAVSLAILLLSQSHELITKLGITSYDLSVSGDAFHARFDSLLRSPIASQLALITFWSLVGLVAYLICWGAYNIVIEARNEVTLTTAYTNRGHWRGPHETLALKAVSGVVLAVLLNYFWSGVSFWIATFGPVVTSASASNLLGALLAVIGLAVQLYLVFVFIQLTFTPWYRVQTFTDV